ncbi:MAG: SpoIIE family protein phosphatase [Spirochaetia bacterium]|nr:SpoIIE family protein phosphatase [Spirochaetia bacterium]
MTARTFGLVLAQLLLFSCAQSGTVHQLNQKWEFHKGFQPEWLAAPPKDGWTAFEYPRFFIDDNIASGYITLRTTIPDAVVQESLSGHTVSINPAWVGDVSEFYWNDKLIGRIGSIDPYESGYSRHKIIDVVPGFARPGGPNTLSVVIFGNGAFPMITEGKMDMGEASAIYTNHFSNEMLSIALIGIYLVVGLYHLLLAVKRPQDKYNLYFGLFAVFVSLYWFHRIYSRDMVYGAHTLLRWKLELISLYQVGPSLIFFLSQFFYKRYSKMGIANVVFAVGLTVVTAVAPNFTVANTALTVWQLTGLVLMLYLMFYIARETFRGNKEALYLLLGIVLLMLGAIHDVAAARGWIHHPHIARFTFMVFILGIAGILANRFMRVHNEVEELNSQLEKKVEDRTKQLQASLSDVQALKEQQDGDYFLTSLLIRPLGGIFVHSDTVRVEYVSRQKKKFHFRKWDAEIGGDLCLASSITLHGKAYTVFVNADAMGKSIQGAGGAIVLGTVFKSLISRTQMSSQSQNRYPEQWLKECFVELQNVFVSFDGTMLVSAVIGLVEDETGMLYYINAEHPWVVLYRAGKARYLEDDLLLRKIGVEGLESSLSVRYCQLEPDDVLVLGSDGRDDLLIGQDGQGNRIINEDSNNFLRVVESGNGDLYRMEQVLLTSGELTDDLSMMRIGYREDAAARAPEDHSPVQSMVEEAKQLAKDGKNDAAVAVLTKACADHPKHSEPLRLLCRLLVDLHRHAEAAEYCERYTELVPADTEFLYYTSYLLKRAGQNPRAADFGERCRLREPLLVHNLVNLADIYRRMNNTERAEMLARKALKIEPDNSKAAALLKHT